MSKLTAKNRTSPPLPLCHSSLRMSTSNIGDKNLNTAKAALGGLTLQEAGIPSHLSRLAEKIYRALASRQGFEYQKVLMSVWYEED
jgi:hypothetical protein